jgi:hypothetical protein
MLFDTKNMIQLGRDNGEIFKKKDCGVSVKSPKPTNDADTCFEPVLRQAPGEVPWAPQEDIFRGGGSPRRRLPRGPAAAGATVLFGRRLLNEFEISTGCLFQQLPGEIENCPS